MDTQAMLTLRISEATDEDRLSGLYFEGALESLRKRHGEEVEAASNQVLGQQHIVGLFKYPISLLLKLVSTILVRKPGLNDCTSLMRSIGAETARMNLDSLLGRTLVTLGKGAPSKLLSLAPGAMMTVASYGERIYERTGDRTGRLIYKRELLGPEIMAGVTARAIELISKVEATITTKVTNASGSDFTLDAWW